MDATQLIAFIRKKETGCFSFECKEQIAKEVEDKILSSVTKIGIVSEEDQVYKKMKVKEYLKFFSKLSQHDMLFSKAVSLFQLQDMLHVTLDQLSNSQLVRVKAAREMIKDMPMIYLKDPLKNLEDQDIELMMKWIDQMEQNKKCILMTSPSLKDVCMMPGHHFYIRTDKEIKEITNLTNEEEIVHPMKIGAKLDDKIMLFNPNEIDYIESLDKKSYVYVRNSSFVCTQTMEELENKLKRFGFYRSHRSYLVNMQKVVEIIKWTRNSYSLKLEGLNDVRIPLSKGRIEEMKSLYDF
ncbi:LytTR family transcriptional regulator DNA-binding domain-containing protein [[Eubacterium] hominis]|uniref:LytTR family transcriptional regulator DNA-binding domain-containing protein n=1 Tax=[Eubacterium] hominis TaxID=2764325 RepID=UPI003A4DF47A